MREHVDLNRLQVATHEIGHMVVWEQLPGAIIREVRVWGRGTGTQGHVLVNWPKRDTPELVHGCLVGLLAGREADRIFTDQHPGFRYDDSGCHYDLCVLRRVRRAHPPSRQWSERELRTDAARLVRACWSRAERLAIRLASHGSIPV